MDHHSSLIKSYKEVTKQKKSRFFLLFLLDDGRIRFRTIRIRIHTNNDVSGSGRSKNIGSGSTTLRNAGPIFSSSKPGLRLLSRKVSFIYWKSSNSELPNTIKYSLFRLPVSSPDPSSLPAKVAVFYTRFLFPSFYSYSLKPVQEHGSRKTGDFKRFGSCLLNCGSGSKWKVLAETDVKT